MKYIRQFLIILFISFLGEVLKYLLTCGKAGAHHVSHIRPGDAYDGLDIEFFRAHIRTSFA